MWICKWNECSYIMNNFGMKSEMLLFLLGILWKGVL